MALCPAGRLRSFGLLLSALLLSACATAPADQGPGGVEAVSWAGAQGGDAGGAPVCRQSDGYALDFGGRRTFTWRPQWLQNIKARSSKNPALAPAFRALVVDAEAALRRGPYTVVDKRKLPASGNRHDYHSIGPYWWPNPEKPGGEPYVRRDGALNPQRNSDAFDTADMSAMSDDVATLSLAEYLTEDRRYADQAARLLRVWFLDPATRMNPNFNHAQAIPGRSAGRAEGLIDAHRLGRVVESIGLLGPSGALSESEVRGLERWFGELVQWMQASRIGRAERAKENNHGIYYDQLISHFALFARREPVARETIAAFPSRRILPQVAADGSLPYELVRTRSFHYTNWTLAAAFDLAALGECVGADLWRFQSPHGRSLKAALDFVAAYHGRVEQWPYPELALRGGRRTGEMQQLFHEVLGRAAWGYRNPDYARKAADYERFASVAIRPLLAAISSQALIED